MFCCICRSSKTTLISERQASQNKDLLEQHKLDPRTTTKAQLVAAKRTQAAQVKRQAQRQGMKTDSPQLKTFA